MAERLAQQHPEIEEIILFGSLATGTAGPASDADLLIVLRDSELEFPERVARYLPEGCSISVDVFPYTRGELEHMAAEGRRLVTEARERGLRLFPYQAT
ncbi:MAG: nucleotidyltransferase domain-containing protein [Bryobacterales bacterium]|nr:nucleotidyltransferase domain-containing protein [Bryobacteraceae bacterium]MDW8355352.1 nucleotidyltransferase domain-containing protein [Bryobacterales bacterium]